MSSLIMEALPTPSAERPSLLWPALAVAAVAVFFGFPGTGGDRLDHVFQSLFWNGKDWWIPHEAPLGKWLAYDGPKGLVILFAVYLLFSAIFPARVPASFGRRRSLYLLACFAMVSVVCTQLRTVTHMATPIDLKLYGGVWDHLLLFQSKPVNYPSHAFPAGHASGGFALLGLYWALPPVRRNLGLAIGLGIGSWMGLYQVARGEHFLSHTLATAALAWLMCAGLARWIKPGAPQA